VPRKLPLVDLQAQYRTLEPEIKAAFERVLERQMFISGPETASFEDEFAAVCEANECVAVSSGTTALELALRALGIGPGDEVITVSHTFFATVGAIVNSGATPVFVDIDPATWTMAPQRVSAAMSEQTKAIVPVHIYGHPADVPAIRAAAPGIPIVEDAAQAHLGRYHEHAIGSKAQAACYSFYPGKNLGAYGDAGAITTNDLELAERIRALRDHGRTGDAKYEHELLGTNARAAELQMAVLRAKLPCLRVWTDERQRLAQRYEQALALSEVELQQVQPWAEHARHLFVLLRPDRDRLIQTLQEAGVGAGVHYPLACHQQPALARRFRSVGGLEVTERVAANCLSLPLYAELGDGGVDQVAETLGSLLLAAAA
jgi:dTDP-3-amino-3,4,6-trideoxy-alpha-D-glucose transaminase